MKKQQGGFKMKRLFITLICMVLVLGQMMNVVFADSAITDISNKANVLICSDEGIDKILNSKTEEISSLDSKLDTNISFTTGKEKNGSANISMNGTFINDGVLCEVNAEGEVKTYKTKKLGKLELGHLKGTITIGENERNINVNYEKSKDNLYYSIAINTLESEEGFAVLSFGQSQLNENVLKEIGVLKDKVDIIETKDYNIRESCYVELDDYEDEGNPVRGRLYLEDDIWDNGQDGKLMVIMSVDKEEVDEILEDNGYNVLLVKVDEFMVNIESVDHESYFTAHFPEESYSSNAVFNFIKNAIGLIPNAGSYLMSAIDAVGSGIGNEIDMTADNMYEKQFEIRPADDTYMDNSVYSTGGYPIELGVEKDDTATDDDIDVDFDMDLQIFLNQGHQGFYISATGGDLDVDLADF